MSEPLDIFTPRGIAPPWHTDGEIARQRGYARYEAGDRDAIRSVDQRWLDPKLHHNDPNFLDRILEAPGWIMPRPTLMPDVPKFRSRPYAQLRPDVPVMRNWTGHSHSGNGMRHRGRDERANHGGRCSCGLVHESKPVKRSRQLKDGTWEQYMDWYQPPLRDKLEHQARVCDPAPAGMSDEELWRYGVRLKDELVREAKGRVLVRTGHRHPDTGHTIVRWDRPHAHLDWAKYIYPPGHGRASRISTHPSVRDGGYAAPEGIMFLALEGVLKCDAIVSADWPAIEAGSVTLWDSSQARDDQLNELQTFARRYLQGVKLAVVCDSDWVLNRRVRDQVRRVVRALAEVNVEAIGCAPPEGDKLGWLDPVTRLPRRAKLGVDDFLARERAKGHDAHAALLTMPILEQAHSDALDALIDEMEEDPRRLKTIRRLIETAQDQAGPGGVVTWDEDFFTAVGRHQTTLLKVRKDLPADVFKELEPPHQYPASSSERRTLGAVYRLRRDLAPVTTGRTVGDWLESS
jgi:hypothetical protein